MRKLESSTPSGTQKKWQAVNNITRERATQQDQQAFGAEVLNQHYAETSTDALYLPSHLKSKALCNSSVLNKHQVFYMVDHLHPTAEGYDKIPSWFLRLLAPVCAAWITHLCNLSLETSWKAAIIHPLPRVSSHHNPSDYRPISLVPVLSRMWGGLLCMDTSTQL